MEFNSTLQLASLKAPIIANRATHDFANYEDNFVQCVSIWIGGRGGMQDTADPFMVPMGSGVIKGPQVSNFDK